MKPTLALRNRLLVSQIALVESMYHVGYKAQDDIFKQLQEGDKNAEEQGFAFRGRLIKFQVADGYAHYLVVKDTAKWIHVKHIPYGDSYRYGGVIDDKIDSRIVWQVVAQQRAWDQIIASARISQGRA